VDLGGQWIGPTQDRVIALAAAGPPNAVAPSRSNSSASSPSDVGGASAAPAVAGSAATGSRSLPLPGLPRRPGSGLC
jgi:hypothetical protein